MEDFTKEELELLHTILPQVNITGNLKTLPAALQSLAIIIKKIELMLEPEKEKPKGKK